MLDESSTTARILVVDDWDVNVRLLEGVLAQAGYANVRGTTEPEKTVDQCEAFDPDLIVLDLQMPRVDGFAILEQLKAHTPVGTYRPVLVLTADVTPATRRRALTSGASEFLTKPLDVQELLQRVELLLDRRRWNRALAPS
jgi:PleD family two-component response regulator